MFPNRAIISIPAATSSRTEIAQPMYVASDSPLSLNRAKAAYNESKKIFITAHQIVHRLLLFHSTTYEIIPKT